MMRWLVAVYVCVCLRVSVRLWCGWNRHLSSPISARLPRGTSSQRRFSGSVVFCVSSLALPFLCVSLRGVYQLVCTVNCAAHSGDMTMSVLYLQTNHFWHTQASRTKYRIHTRGINRPKLMLNEIAYDELRGEGGLLFSFYFR